MKYFAIFLILIGFTGTAFATHDPTYNHPTPFEFSKSFTDKTNYNEDKTILNRTVYSEPWQTNVTEIEIQTDSVYLNGTMFGLTSSYIYKPTLVIIIIIAITIPSFVVWRTWRKRK